MPVITLSRELGSRGDDIALELSRRLGWQIAGRDVINRAARAAGAPEVALAEIDELGLFGLKPTAAALAQYAEKIVEVIHELADAGDFILVGRGAQIALAHRRDALHVRVIAPRDQRIATVAERCNIKKEAAAARVDASDRARSSFLQRNYRIKWDDPLLYDIVLNTAQLGVPACVETICAALALKGPQSVSPIGDGAA